MMLLLVHSFRAYHYRLKIGSLTVVAVNDPVLMACLLGRSSYDVHEGGPEVIRLGHLNTVWLYTSNTMHQVL